MLKESRRLTLTSPARYRVCIQGRLDSTWSDELGGMTFTNYCGSHQPMATVLTGQMMDQAELMGVLSRLYGLGFPLLSVECLEIEDKVADAFKELKFELIASNLSQEQDDRLRAVFADEE